MKFLALLLTSIALYAGDAGKRMTHIEVTCGPPTVTTYRFDDGSATAVVTEVNAKTPQQQRVTIPTPPSSSAGWSMCASIFDVQSYHKPGLILFHNGTDKTLQVDVDGKYGAIVPSRGWVISVEPARIDPINARPTLHAKDPAYTQHEQGPVAWIGNASP